jgi:DNA mismatch endonuclease (patch repair protein)
MGRIRGSHTTPERVMRSALWATGLRYRLHARGVVGRPDIVIRKNKIAVFVDGCFWHGCPRHYVRPRTRAEFWADKLSANVLRDRAQTLQLEAAGWRVLRFWECQVVEGPVECARRVVSAEVEHAGKPKAAWRVLRVDLIDPANDVERRHLVDLRREFDARVEVRRRSTSKARASSSLRAVRKRSPMRPLSS